MLQAGFNLDAEQAGTRSALVDVIIEHLANEMPSTDGIPSIAEVRLPMLNLHLAWYETTQRPGFSPYNVHPLKAEDYNLESGGDSDLHQPLVAPFSGLVTSADQFSGTRGRIVQILGVSEQFGHVVWAGWHLRKLTVETGDVVFVGDHIGTIGNAGGLYYAHLHNTFLVLNDWGIPSPTTYPTDVRYDWRRPSVLFGQMGVDAETIARVMNYDGN
jgi:hypothetical protein